MLDDIFEALWEIAKALQSAWDVLEDALEEVRKLASDAQKMIDERAKDRKRWGHPPKKMIATYKEPAKRIRPCARSFGRR